jgi:hypothetical protein
MRLINVRTFKLELLQGNENPPYAILSHTWGAEEKEVSFTEFENDHTARMRSKPGFKKIAMLCHEAQLNGIDYAWADTSCIDKSSSAELSEAINSMFRWYQRARVCYAYLSDVELPADFDSSELPTTTRDELLRKSRWFTRGWTLQELLAPSVLEFFDVNWRKIGDKISCCDIISSITGICQEVILDPSLLDIDRRVFAPNPEFYYVALFTTRMSWAAKRMTTRPEDMAYSLMGIFHVHMPLLYGEGSQVAFRRLQYEMFKKTSSNSLLAWGLELDHCIEPSFDLKKVFPSRLDRLSILAGSPAQFASTPERIYTFVKAISEQKSWTVNNRGIETEVMVITHDSWFVEEPIDDNGFQRRHDLAIAMLPFKASAGDMEYFGFLLSGNSDERIYNRIRSLEGAATLKIPARLAIHAKSQAIFLSDAPVHREWRTPSAREKTVIVDCLDFQVHDVLARYCEWKPQTQQIMLQPDSLEDVQEALLRITDERDPESYFYLLVSNSVIDPDTLPESLPPSQRWRFRKLGMSVIPNEEVVILESPAQFTQYLIAPRSEMVVSMGSAKAIVILQEHGAWWDMIYMLSIRTMGY